jgi:hypothetical protein
MQKALALIGALILITISLDSQATTTPAQGDRLADLKCVSPFLNSSPEKGQHVYFLHPKSLSGFDEGTLLGYSPDGTFAYVSVEGTGLVTRVSADHLSVALKGSPSSVLPTYFQLWKVPVLGSGQKESSVLGYFSDGHLIAREEGGAIRLMGPDESARFTSCGEIQVGDMIIKSKTGDVVGQILGFNQQGHAAVMSNNPWPFGPTQTIRFYQVSSKIGEAKKGLVVEKVTCKRLLSP